MLKALNALKVASAAAFTVAFIPLAAPTNAITCDDVKFVFARGSGQELNDKEYSALKRELKSEISRGGSDLHYSFYELGTGRYGGASYSAVNITPFNAIGAKISAGNATSYGKSVKEGITELKAYIKEISSSCPSTRFVLAGYSQGAQVITQAAEELNTRKIIYAATFGDPKLYLPEGKGLNPDACRGKNLSPYRKYAPNCRTKEGSLGAKNPYQTPSWAGKKGLWCNNKDIICGSGLSLTGGEGSNLLSRLLNSVIDGHTSYVDDGIIASSAKTIVEKLRAFYPTRIGKSNAAAYNRDTIILIDRTNSMTNLISKYKTEAQKLATDTVAGGGRVALYTYGELRENEYPQKLSSFGDPLSNFYSALDNITVYGGGDNPESMLSAISTAMTEQKWRAGATKTIVVLTDANYHNPDIDGTTVADVIKKSYEIDPVSVYVINEIPPYNSDYELITVPTGGQIFNSVDSISTDLLTSRPNVTLPLEEYVGSPGAEFTFNAAASDNIASYSWDLDFDGEFETTTTEPTITKTFYEVGQGYITVKATDAEGNSSTTSAKIIITNNLTEPEIVNLRAEEHDESPAEATLDDIAATTLDPLVTGISKRSAAISYQFKNSAALALISVDDAPIGFTDQTSFELADIEHQTTVNLTPISGTGQTGEPVSIKLATDLEPMQLGDNFADEDREQSESNSDTSDSPSDANSATEVGNTIGSIDAINANVGYGSTPTDLTGAPNQSAAIVSSNSKESVQIIRILAPNSGKK